MKPRRGGLHPIQEALDAFLDSSGLKASATPIRVFRAWRDAVGRAMAKRTRPVRFRRGELVVEVESAAHLQELSSFTGEGYRRRVNARMGKEVVETVVFKLKH